jgi:hypothetical protein
MYFRKGPGTFSKKVYYLDYCKESSGFCSMIKHIILFVLGVHSGVRNEKTLNRGALKYKLSNRSMDQLDDGLTPPAPSRFEERVKPKPRVSTETSVNQKNTLSSYK